MYGFNAFVCILCFGVALFPETETLWRLINLVAAAINGCIAYSNIKKKD
jgi:hypothetical protein